MKSGTWLWFWWALGAVLSAGEPEVRCYQVEWSYLERAEISPVIDDLSEQSDEFEPFWQKVEEAGFESRFLKGAGELRDCRQLFAGWFDGEFTGEAVYDMKQRRLVVQAAPEDHEAAAKILGDDIPRQMRLRVAVFEMPSGSGAAGATYWEDMPAEAKELASLASIGVPGQTFDARTTGGELALEAEYQIDVNSDLVELRATIRFQKGVKKLKVKSGWTLPLGVTWVEKVGSVDGETTLILTLKADLMQPSGVLFDEWILQEKGGAFLREARLQGMRSKPKVSLVNENGTVYREFWVPPTFLSFISTTGSDGGVIDDPFAADPGPNVEKKVERWPGYEGIAPELRGWRTGHLVDIRKLLMENGLEFRDEDFAVFSRHQSKVIAKLPAIQMMLLEGIIGPGPLELPRHVRVKLEQWEGGENGQITGDRTVGTLSSTAVPGQTASMQLGPRHSLEIEGQIDANDSLIEIRSSLFTGHGKKKNPVFRTGLTLNGDQPVVIHESRIDGKRRVWVITARIIDLARELDEFLKGQGR